MGKDDYGPISQYNSLIDPNLQGYYSKSIVRHHLRQTGLINRKGEIIPEDVWRKKIHTKERMEQASRLIASKIVQQAIEIKNLERAEIRRKLEEVSKRELVKRVRGKSLQNRQLPLLWSNKDDSYNDYHNRRTQSRSMSPKNEDYDIKVVDEDQDIDHRVFVPRPPKQKPLKKIRFRRRFTANRFARGFSAVPKPEPVVITMIYYGKGIKIPFDTQVFESKDEIAIYQQHCGGENLLVYSGLHEKGDKFSFHSKRHKEFPFGLTIFLNGKYDCRISTCCEYRHNLNVRIGINGSFGMTNVVGDHPCVKCLWEKNQKKPPRKLRSLIDPDTGTGTGKDKNGLNPKDDTDEEIDPIVEKPIILPATTDYDDDFNDGDDWQIKVYTSDLKGKSFEGTDSRVYISLIGSQNETDKYWLDKSNCKSKNKDLFEAGNMDEFLITSNIDLDKLHQIRIGHDGSSFGSAWHLEKVEVINKKDGTLYLFLCNRWLSKDEDDGEVERILSLKEDLNSSFTKNSEKSIKLSSRKSSTGLGSTKEPEIERTGTSSKLDLSRSSSKAESAKIKSPVSSSDDSDNSDDSTAKEEEETQEEGKKASKMSSRQSNRSLNETKQSKSSLNESKRSLNATPSKNENNTLNLIQGLIQKNNQESNNGSKSSLRSKEKTNESRNSSRLSNKSNGAVAQNEPVIPVVNIIGSSDVDENSKSTSSLSKNQTLDKSNSQNKSNSSLQINKKVIYGPNGKDKNNDSDDSDSDSSENESVQAKKNDDN